MSQVSGQGTLWNLPNYAGDLFTADAIQTPFLTAIGGLTGGMMTDNFQFPTCSLYDFPAASQPAITETASLAAPTSTEYVRTQETNVTQIFQEAIMVSYEKLANAGRLSGLNTVGQANNAPSELDFQVTNALKKIARDIEYTFLNGAYSLAANAGQASGTRGMIAAASSTTAAGGATLSKALIDGLLLKMATAGAVFGNMVMYVNGFQKQKISEIYTFVPTDRNIGGSNIQYIETDFCKIGVVYNRFMDTDELLIADLSVCAPVFQPVPGKGNFFLEELAKVGASQNYQIYGKIGLDHGPGFMHGTLTGLATS
jgi:hypothetical protein